MKKGFTLLELLIVIIIVGILAATSVPMMAKNVRKAYATEAITALGMIRTQMRYAYTVTRDYGKMPNGGTLGGWQIVAGNVVGVGWSDLNGTFFDPDDYWIGVPTSDTFYVNVIGGFGAHTAPQWKKAEGINITIYQDGSITVHSY